MTLRMCAGAETSSRSDFRALSLAVCRRGGGTYETSVDSGGARSESVWLGLSSRKGPCEVEKQPLIYAQTALGYIYTHCLSPRVCYEACVGCCENFTAGCLPPRWPRVLKRLCLKREKAPHLYQRDWP